MYLYIMFTLSPVKNERNLLKVFKLKYSILNFHPNEGCYKTHKYIIHSKSSFDCLNIVFNGQNFFANDICSWLFFEFRSSI